MSETQQYFVYIKRNEYCEIIDVCSSTSLKDMDGWEQFDAGCGDEYRYAQEKFFPKPIVDENGVYRYCAYYEDFQFADGDSAYGFVIEERTDEEMKELAAE